MRSKIFNFVFHSSVGRAFGSYPEGRRFKPVWRNSFFSFTFLLHVLITTSLFINYILFYFVRVMQCTVKLRSFFIRSLSFHVISGIIVKDSTIEFSIKELDGDSTRKKSSELRSMVFRGVKNILFLFYSLFLLSPAPLRRYIL